MREPRLRLRRRAGAMLLLPIAVVLGVACGVAVEEPTATVPVATPTATAVPSPTPDGRLTEDGGIALVQRAYERLLTEYIHPVEPSRLLDGAWTLFAVEAEHAGIAVPVKPAFSDDRVSDFELYRQAYVQVASQAADPAPLRYASIRGMAQALQDCHTFFLSPVASETLQDTRAGKGTVGIGVDLSGVPARVTEVITAGPAERAGVRLGDTIVEIDGEDAHPFGPASVFERVNGDEGTTVELGLQREGEASIVFVTVKRERVSPPNVESRIVEGTTLGYVRVRNFVANGIAMDLRRALDGFEAQGATGWILDLRGNPGGILDVEAISLFVPAGVIVRDQNRAGEVHEDLATGDALPALRPTALLTNGRTGSVAEVFAAALDEYEVAHVIGENTNGCVGYTWMEPLGDGTSLAVTTNVNLGPVSGTVLNGVGVAPDELVRRTTDDIAAIRDPQLDAAIAYLQTATGSTP